MRANATITVLTLIAIHAKNLITIGEAIPNKPSINIVMATAIVLFTEPIAAIVDVIDCQKQ